MDLNKSLSNLNNKINLDTSKKQISNNWSEINESFLQDLEGPFDPDNEDTSLLRNDEQYKGFDNDAGGQYIYPINYPIRTYQFNISKVCLFKNTLIVLPTGLGKTFIAAVVMYNIYRWYPTGKVIFMAPTRPLVSQQIEACCKIMGIPVDDTAEMTGKQNKNKRLELWQNKRIFFATPQVVQLDINDPELNFPFHKIKLVVVDEAHKAKGRYAYTDVIQTINNRNPYFRIIALSATPGRRIEDVMEIIQNLCISHVEVRSENSIDVQPFTFRKTIKTILVPLGEQLTRIRNELINIIDPYVRNLIDNGVLNGNTGNFTKFWLVMEQKRFREISINQRHPKHSIVSTDFSICISLYHALELLERHGLRVFLNFFDDTENQNEKFFVQTNPKLKKFLNNLRQEVGPNPFAISDQTMTNGKIPIIPDNLDFGHPKFEMVKEFLVDHFQEQKESKVIVFCEFRESVMLLHRLLLQSRPLILPRIFVGQGGTGSIRAVSQKEQMQVMNDFRNGIVNTLIATSVAEEGIDVGEVNLIICFDISSKNPTRFVQRIGRTGRKQQGQVIMLATEGKEHSLVKEVLATRDKVNQKISKNRSINNILYKRSPRIVPPEFNPKCLEVFMKAQDKKQENTNNNKIIKKTDTKGNKKCRRRKITEIDPPTQDVRNFFKKIELDNKDKEIFCSPEITSNIMPDNDLINVDNLINEFSPVTQFEKPNTSSSQVQLLSQISNKTSHNIELNFRKLNHLTRKLDKKTNLPNYSNILETIQSKNVEKYVKIFILQNNVNFVREKFETMQVIWSLNRNEIDNLADIDDSEKQIRLIYSSIEDVLGDKNDIEIFIKQNSDNNLKKGNQIKKLDDKFADFFEEFEERDFTDSVQGFIMQKLNEIDLNLLEPEQEKIAVVKICSDNDTSISYKNLLDVETDESTTNYEFDLDFENESKYSNQWTQSDDQIKHQSTPISKKLNNQNSNILINSPLAIAFQNGINRKCLPTVQENVIGENEMNKTDIKITATKLSYEQNTNLLTKKNDLLKTDSPSTEQSKNYSLNNNNINSKFSSNNLDKSYEISADLFDDDFDEIFANDEILNTIENNCNKNTQCIKQVPLKSILPATKSPFKEEINKNNVFSNSKSFDFIKPQFGSSKDKQKIKESSINIVKPTIENMVTENGYNFIKPKTSPSIENKKNNIFTKEYPIYSQNDTIEQSMLMSMIDVDKILEIVAEKERAEKEKHNITNPELEDFDLNDFLEPFEAETEWIEKNSKENTPPEKLRGTICRQISDDIFDYSLSKSTNEIQQHTPCIENTSENINDNSILISPSIIGRRRPNFSQLKHLTRQNNSTHSTPSSEMKEIKTAEQLNNIGAAAKCLFNVSADINYLKIQNTTAEESIIRRPSRKLNNIIESSESDEENADDNEICQLSQELRITPTKTRALQRCNDRKQNRRKHQKRFQQFVDDEAVHSGNDSSDDEICDGTNIFDSIVVMDSEEEEDDPNVNMYAKYLQSTRSPKHLARGAFKIPPQRKFMDLSRIFSQPVKPDDTFNDCSFVVSDEDNVFDGEVSEICPLEQAEAILKARKKTNKRKQKELNVNGNGNEYKRRRIINNFIEISDED